MDSAHEETTSQEEVRNSAVFSCPSCGSNMHFNPENQALACPYCGGTLAIDSSVDRIIEHDFAEEKTLRAIDWGSKTRSFRCNNCGAETVLEAHKIARHCAFCASSHIVKIEEEPGIPPESLIPFKITPGKAKDRCRITIPRYSFR